jgi:Domain of unknown function (DUF4272)
MCSRRTKLEGLGKDNDTSKVLDSLAAYIVAEFDGPKICEVLRSIGGVCVRYVIEVDETIIRNLGTAVSQLIHERVGGIVCDRRKRQVATELIWVPETDEHVLSWDDCQEVGERAVNDGMPTEDRISDRLAVLIAVAQVGLQGDNARDEAVHWLSALELVAECESTELMEMAYRCGADSEVNMAWRAEGAAALAWSLGLVELPRWFAAVDAEDLGRSLGWPSPETIIDKLLEGNLRSSSEIETLRVQTFSIMWRLRNEKYGLVEEEFNFVEWVKSDAAAFADFDLCGCEIINNDLAINGMPIRDARPEDLQRAHSITGERMYALNWLRDGGLYSETDMST